MAQLLKEAPAPTPHQGGVPPFWARGAAPLRLGGGSPPEIEGLFEGGSPPETEGGGCPPPTLPREAPLPGEGKGGGSFHKVETLTAAGRGSTQIRLYWKTHMPRRDFRRSGGRALIWG